MTLPSEPKPKPIPSEEELDRIFAEHHERAVAELESMKQAERLVVAATGYPPKSQWCTKCFSSHTEDAVDLCKKRANAVREAEKRRREEAETAWIVKQRDRIPVRFWEAKADHPKVHAWIHRWESDDVDPTIKESLLLTGPVGTGKTHQMFGVMNEALLLAAFERFEFANVPALLTSLRPGGDEVDLDKFKKADWLFLDDLTGHKASEWAEERLYELINYRYEYKLVTVLTTNTTAKELGAVLGERIASRLAEMCEVVAITGKDRRRAR